LKTEKLRTKKYKTDMLRRIGKQSGKSVESVPKKKTKVMMGRICGKGMFLTLKVNQLELRRLLYQALCARHETRWKTRGPIYKIT